MNVSDHRENVLYKLGDEKVIHFLTISPFQEIKHSSLLATGGLVDIIVSWANVRKLSTRHIHNNSIRSYRDYP